MSETRAGGMMDRRELIAALARWSVPTVVTLTLGARALHAASCPPCTKRVSGVCKACSTSQILNCQCEPCLGPPYCVTPAAPAFQMAPGAGSAGGPGATSGQPGGMPGGAGSRGGFGVPGQLGGSGYDDRQGGTPGSQGLRGPTSGTPLGGLYQPFAPQPRYRPLGGSGTTQDNGGLYGRLRGDTINTRRRP